jgi:hypothetical protein
MKIGPIMCAACFAVGCNGSGISVISVMKGSELAATKQPAALAFDDDNVYWLDEHGLISSVPKAGGAPSVIGSAVAAGDGDGCYDGQLAMHAGTLFAICRGLAQVSQAGVSETIDPLAVVFALDADNLYWVSLDGPLRSRPLAGGTATTIATLDGNSYGLAAAAGQLYYALDARVPTNQGIWAVPIQGGTPQQLVQEKPFLGLGDVIVRGGYIYYQAAGDELRRAPVVGGTPSLLVKAATMASLVADDSFLYWHEGLTGDGFALLKRMPLGGGGSATLVADHVDITAFVSDGNDLFYATDAVLRERQVGITEVGQMGGNVWEADYSNGGSLFAIALR